VTGANSPLMHAAASLVLNAAKHLAGIPQDRHLLPATVIDALGHLKTEVLHGRRVSLDAEEALIALAVSATTDPAARRAVDQLQHLRGCEVHLTHMPTPGDEAGLRKLGVNLTSTRGSPPSTSTWGSGCGYLATGPRYVSSQASVSLMNSTRGGMWSVS
jgi:uncharacterized protein (UPF0371 family)